MAWSTSNNDEFRHVYGTNRLTKRLVSLCEKEADGPLDYLKLYLEKCERCESLAGKEKRG